MPTWAKQHLKLAAAPYLYSGPSPTAALATVLAGFDVNERRGDAVRRILHSRTARVLAHLSRLGVHTPNTTGTPIIEVPLARADDIDLVGKLLWGAGIYVTLAAYPLVPRSQVGLRIQLTAAHTDDEVDELLDMVTRLVDQALLQRAPAAA